MLYVGDCVYRTSLDTLCCIDGSRFPELLRDVAQTSAGWQLTIDRDGKVVGQKLAQYRRRLGTRPRVPMHKGSTSWSRNMQMFGYILDYLRATSSGLGSLAPLPCEDQAVRLLDEARFYRIPGQERQISVTICVFAAL